MTFIIGRWATTNEKDKRLFFVGTQREQEELQTTLCLLDQVAREAGATSAAAAAAATRDAMPDALRVATLSTAQLDDRNFRVLKAYVNVVEYLVDGFALKAVSV